MPARNRVNWQVRMDKVSLVLSSLPADFARRLSKQLGSKLRSQVKRVERESPTVRIGGAELLGDFYGLFCRNLRDLGTPVYPRRFFAKILERFPGECLLVVVDRAGQLAAGAFLVIDAGRAEIPWAACREDAKPAGFNMKLYWEVLRTVVERNCTRSSTSAARPWTAAPTNSSCSGARPRSSYIGTAGIALPPPTRHRPAAESPPRGRYATSVWKTAPRSE